MTNFFLVSFFYIRLISNTDTLGRQFGEFSQPSLKMSLGLLHRLFLTRTFKWIFQDVVSETVTMEKVPTIEEVLIRLQSTTTDIRLKNAQLAGVIEYLDAGYEPRVNDFCPNRAKFLDHILLSLKDDLRDFEINIKEYVSET